MADCLGNMSDDVTQLLIVEFLWKIKMGHDYNSNKFNLRGKYA